MAKKILLISPHPDDAEFGVGMALLSRLDQGEIVKSLVICLGNKASEYATREEELQLVRDSYSYQVELLGRAAPADLHRLITELEKKIRDFEPDVLYLPFSQDRHQDHKIVSEAASIAGRSVPNKYYYCTPSTRSFEANHYFIGNKDLLQRKIDLLSCFFSQREKAYLSPNEIRAYAQTSGRNALLYSQGVHYAEPFVTQTLDYASQKTKANKLSKSDEFDELFFPRSKQRLAELLNGFIDPDQISSKQFPWELIELISEIDLSKGSTKQVVSTGGLRIEGEVRVEEGVKLPENGVITGPVYISKNAVIQEYSVIIGPSYIGQEVRVGYHSSVRACVLCPQVQIGQRVDLTRTIILDRSMLSHGNTVGDSFIGCDCWLAGKTDVANLRVDRRPVRANIGGRRYTTKGKYGATIEDGVQFPALVVMLPGSYVTKTLRLQIKDLVSGNRVHKTR